MTLLLPTEIESPDAGTTTSVEHTTKWLVANWAQQQLVVLREDTAVVLEVCKSQRRSGSGVTDIMSLTHQGECFLSIAGQQRYSSNVYGCFV